MEVEPTGQRAPKWPKRVYRCAQPGRHLVGNARIASGRVCVTTRCLSVPSIDPLRRVCCCGSGGQEISIDSGAAAAWRTAARRSAAANASSVTLSADAGS